MRINLRDIAGAAASDPRLSLLERCGSMIDYEIFHNLVLVATYIRPPRMMKGADGKPIEFHFTDKTLSEDRFQGKIGLVLKMGPLAFRDDAVAKFGGITVEEGDWVLFRPSDATELFIRDRKSPRDDDGISCRLLEDTLIRGRVSNPTLVY